MIDGGGEKTTRDTENMLHITSLKREKEEDVMGSMLGIARHIHWNLDAANSADGLEALREFAYWKRK